MTDARATRLREETIHDIPVSTTGARRSLSVTFVYDENAVMALEAKIEGTDKTLPLRYDARRSPRDIAESAQRVRQLWSYTGQAEEEGEKGRQGEEEKPETQSKIETRNSAIETPSTARRLKQPSTLNRVGLALGSPERSLEATETYRFDTQQPGAARYDQATARFIRNREAQRRSESERGRYQRN